ncbi:MAG: Mut7-C RNAse domain-containing protein [Nitrososphaerota archaeon]
MKFILDTMLGNLLTWLRLLGHDTVYWRGSRDTDLIEAAVSEGRTILTRDSLLHRRALKWHASSILLPTSETLEALRLIQSMAGIRMTFNPASTRCPKCNERLEMTSENPPRWRCPGCGKEYWMGGHWRNIGIVLEVLSHG